MGKEYKDSKEILKLWFSGVVDSILNNNQIWTDKLNEIKYELKQLSKKSEEEYMVIFCLPPNKCFTFELQKYPDDKSTPIYPEPKLIWEEVNDIIKLDWKEFWHKINKEGHELDEYEIFLMENYEYKKTGIMFNYGNYLKEERKKVITGYKLVLRVGNDNDPNDNSSCIIL